MVIDSSAIMAIALEEPDASMYLFAILNSPVRLLSAATLTELYVVAIRREGAKAAEDLDELRQRLEIQVFPVDRDQAMLARDAFLRFGKGHHPASLNFGDCFSYALAKQAGDALLFKGDDFAQTDILRA